MQWPNGQMAKWPNGQMAKWPNGQMAKWPNGQMAKWQIAMVIVIRTNVLSKKRIPLSTHQFLLGNFHLLSLNCKKSYYNFIRLIFHCMCQ